MDPYIYLFRFLISKPNCFSLKTASSPEEVIIDTVFFMLIGCFHMTSLIRREIQMEGRK